MFAFKIWGKFACFRDPLSISQNITLPLPPKTTVGGMLAALLGVDDYLSDDDFMGFGWRHFKENLFAKLHKRLHQKNKSSSK